MSRERIYYSDFNRAFIRARRANSFSQLAMVALYEHLRLVEVPTDEQTRFIAYQYTEYEDMRDFRSTYGDDFNNWVDIEDVTTLIPVSEKGFIIKEF